ncbi:hypothetical protein VNI00_005109 [Paramarasmius palmivorus]|uniref:3-carboxymuconate cyclase n=1 Tax=Paramarasmius palmivorus TaxID=297713 RepID=A0AAW0DLC1_9AGAR
MLMVSATSASPVMRRAGQGKKMQMGNSRGFATGAAYFITNEPDGNFVVAADIGSDGRLNLRQAVSTGGFGLHGDDGGANGPDPLFTQGAIKASAASNMLATVNAGSNTISLFSINPQDPSNLKRVGEPIGSGGEFPVSVAFNKAGDTLCALNGGEVNSVSCFKVDQAKGLVPASGTNRALNLNQTTPANGPAGTVSHVLFSEDNKQLVASVKGVPPTPGFLAVWDVNEDGSLSKEFQQVAPAEGGLLPFSMTLIPGKNAILATDAGIGFDIFDFSAQNVNGSSSRNSAVAIDGQMATCWSSFSSKTGNFYLTDIGTSQVTEISIDDNLQGKIVKQYFQGAGSGTIDNDIVTVGNNDFMYVLSANATAIDVLALNAPGNAANIQKVDLAGPARAAGLKISGSNLQGMTTFIRQS